MKVRRPRGRNIGRALGLICRAMYDAALDEDFGSAMGAPTDELRPLLNRGIAREQRRLRRRVKAITGLKYRVFEQEAARRTSPRYLYERLGDPFAWMHSVERPR